MTIAHTAPDGGPERLQHTPVSAEAIPVLAVAVTLWRVEVGGWRWSLADGGGRWRLRRTWTGAAITLAADGMVLCD